MERLTEHHYFKASGHYMKCTEDCYLEDVDCGDCQKLDKLVDRLGAYEDTGLTPERCAELIAANHRLGLALARAEADLRKIGDCPYCQHWKHEHCPLPKDQAMGGSCFVWR